MDDSSNEQPVDKGTPEKIKRSRGESVCKYKHRIQKYRAEWENLAFCKGWLKGVREKNTRAKCIACNTEMTAELSVIKTHSAGIGHKRKVTGIATGNQKTITSMMSKETSPINVQVQQAEIRLAGFFAEHNVAFNIADHLTPLLKKCFPDSRIAEKIHLGHTKVNNIINNVIGQSSRQSLIEELKKSKFSILIDESTDIACKKSMCIEVRFFSSNEEKVVSRHFRLVNVFENSEDAETGATAEQLYNKMIATLNDAQLPLTNLIGFGSDGCNAMMGEHNSVSSRLINAFPGITILKCICHSLHLCASEACKVLPRRAEDLAREIYNFFKSSNKRREQLKLFQDFCEIKPHKILRNSQVRWLSLMFVVKRILEQWQPLQLYFCDQWLEERLVAAETICQALQDPQIKLVFLFLDWILPKVTKGNVYFQSEKTVITFLDRKMREMYQEFLLVYLEPDYVHKTKLKDINPENERKFISLDQMYLGVKVLDVLSKPEFRREKEMISDFQRRCRQFLITICMEMKKRYDFGDTILSKLIYFSPSNALSVEFRKEVSTLMPIIKLVPRIINPNDTEKIQSIDDEWRNFSNSIILPDDIKMNPKQNVDLFWFKVNNLEDHSGDFPFRNLASFALDLLVLPHSNATCERVFSKINLNKTKTRNRLSTQTMNGILSAAECVKANDGHCTGFQPSDDMLKKMTSSSLYKLVGK